MGKKRSTISLIAFQLLFGFLVIMLANILYNGEVTYLEAFGSLNEYFIPTFLVSIGILISLHAIYRYFKQPYRIF